MKVCTRVLFIIDKINYHQDGRASALCGVAAEIFLFRNSRPLCLHANIKSATCTHTATVVGGRKVGGPPSAPQCSFLVDKKYYVACVCLITCRYICTDEDNSMPK